jgi:nucleotide-binding universal stress UspA family protein
MAAKLGLRLAMPVSVVHVIEPAYSPTIFLDMAQRVARERLLESEQRLQRSTATLTAPVLSVDTALGTPADVLALRASEPALPPALIVIGLGGTDPRAQLGSTALRVLADARAPVLAVPPRRGFPSRRSESAPVRCRSARAV